ncbi:hypothetical protein KJ980_03060, partial [Patescibacteria group bacterium]|nr:hypothetical protein [Patescibacteria group bacterium]
MRKKTTHSKEAENRQLEVAIRKTRQKTELLVIQPKFREDITKLRVKWNVPSQGLCSDEEFDKWQNSLNQENWKY